MTHATSLTPGTHAPLRDRQKRILGFLQEQHIGVLSTVTPDGNPHGAVVYYTIDDTFDIHILTKTGTRKYDNMVHNSHVTLTVCRSETQTTAQVTGIAAERSGRNDINQVASDIATKTRHNADDGLPPIMKLQAGTFTTFRIKPVQIRMAIYARPVPGNYDEIFDSIESFDLSAQN
ncbi:pyridoxamine 5'-phosphate oxidase family protein [Candidatus Saccharibacteria bacterium]|nr:MAG: pyridoxamine 5'-phosphate oxidase family protein [Candidatus Saccharibacteria bacterium]